MNRITLYEEKPQIPELAVGFAELEAMRERRAEIALTAARYIVANGGTTDNPELYYTAMFGRGYHEGTYEHDEHLLTPCGIVRHLELTKAGEPLLIRSPEFPNNNITVGVTASIVDDVYKPAIFKVAMETNTDDYQSWRGHLAIGMREVVPTREEEQRTFKLDEEVSELAVCETATWMMRHGGLEIHTKGTGGVEAGELIHQNSHPEGRYHEQKLWWLRQLQAPTQKKELTPDMLDFRRTIRAVRKEAAEAQSISEGHATARGLSPTIKGFLGLLEPYAGTDQPRTIDVKALYGKWHNPYDARDLLAELELRELVVEDAEGNLVVSDLGREALQHLEW